ncbi:MAG: alpha/beta fold hydrolase [Treponema sp.]|nr:alpha/beta fold hydrolase [Treponema sp.]
MKEKQVTIGEGGKYPLNGIFTFPDNPSQKVPAVVLVHGSGPNDMDETVFKNKPFRDIADYLPTKGIAVLRYNKRTFVYGKQMAKEKDSRNFTVKDETIEDAILAANLLRDDDSIDPNRIYIVGHSLGGVLAPRIDAEGGNFAGIIILAGSSRSLIDIIISQNEEMIPQLGKLLQFIAKKRFASVKAKLEAIPTMTESEAKNAKLFGQNLVWYLKEMAEHPVADYLKATEKPVLILHGGKDFQVTMEKDFALYREICAGKQNIGFKVYPELNHLFMKSIYGNLKDYKREYNVPQKVDPTVLDDIAEFVFRG